jgi:hypothetical protein
MALKFPSPSFRVGTIKDSVYSLSSAIEYIEDSGKAIVQDLGSSPDGKSYYEWRIIPKNGMAPFAIYDYKLGVDPGDEDNFEEEFEFSIGGDSQDAVNSAKVFGFNVAPDQTTEAYNIGDNKEVITKESPEINEDLIAKAEMALKGKADLGDYLESLKNDIRLNGEEGYSDYTTNQDWEEDYFNYTSMNEVFTRQMKYKAGIIK